MLKPFYQNKGKRIVKSPKLYFLDTGLVCFLNGITTREQVFKGPLAGTLFEANVILEIIKKCYNKGLMANVYWWRTSSNEEVDLIIESRGKLVPIEIKLTTKINPRMLKNLEGFCDVFRDKVDKAFLVSLSNERLKVNKNVEIIPLRDFIFYEMERIFRG